MNAEPPLAEVVAQYERFGWKPQRLLLTAGTRVSASAISAAGLDRIERHESEIDAIWFTRRSIADTESWELRRLSGTPYALVTVVEDSATDDEREELLADTEQRLIENSGRFLGGATRTS